MYAVTLLSLLNCIVSNGFLSAAECWLETIFSNFSTSTPLNSQLHNSVCTDKWHWLAPDKFSAEGYSDACSAVLRGLLSVYRTDYRQSAFIASGAHTESVLPRVRTPIIYEGGNGFQSNGFQSCTVAVTLFIDVQ